jgi:glycosyltransferase involved in cell wall biosynthesis
MNKLSIIIPVYNVEKYIGRCIESCLKQDIPLDDYELLIVDDGSLDKSMDVVRRYAQQYQNIRMFQQSNAGPSIARNRGIREAQGEYIWFIDSDDDIKENSLKMLLDKAYDKAVDILCFDINIIENGEVTQTYPHYSDKEGIIYDGKTYFYEIAMPQSACVAFFRKSFLVENNLTFIPGISHEDYEFTPKAYCLAKKITYTPLAAYNYWVRPGSRQTSVTEESRLKKAKDMLYICDSLYAFMNKNLQKGSGAYQVMVGKINFAFSQSLRNHTKGSPSLSDYKEKPYYPLNISYEGDKRNRFKYRLVNFSIPIYLLMHKIMKQ